MADQSQGPGWWLASDGKWYPPDQAPPVPPSETWAAAPAGQPPASGMSPGTKVVLAVVGGFFCIVVLAVLAVALLADDDESSPERTGTTVEEPPAVELPSGFTRLEGDGVTIAAPESWEQLERPEDFAMTPEEFEEALPNAPEGMAEQTATMFEQGAVLVAFGPGVDFLPTVNILESPGEAPLAVVESQAATELGAFGGELIESGRVQLPAGEALRVAYSLSVEEGATSVVYGVQYYVPVDGRTYTITVTAPDEAPVLADQMAETFRVS